MTKRKKNESNKQQYVVVYKITGRVHATIEASSQEEAERIAESFEVETDDGHIEWQFDDIVSVTPN